MSSQVEVRRSVENMLNASRAYGENCMKNGHNEDLFLKVRDTYLEHRDVLDEYFNDYREFPELANMQITVADDGRSSRPNGDEDQYVYAEHVCVTDRCDCRA